MFAYVYENLNPKGLADYDDAYQALFRFLKEHPREEIMANITEVFIKSGVIELDTPTMKRLLKTYYHYAYVKCPKGTRLQEFYEETYKELLTGQSVLIRVDNPEHPYYFVSREGIVFGTKEPLPLIKVLGYWFAKDGTYGTECNG